MQFLISNLMTMACLAFGSAFYLPAHGGKDGKPAPRKSEPKAQAETRSFAVAELFSSEGCHSCTNAYNIVQRLTARAARAGSNLYLLDYHVDYWNDKGWTDPYSKKKFSDRQRRYSTIFPKAGMYTPQVVVNGSAEMVGSDEVKVHRAVKDALGAEAKFGVKIGQATISKDSMLIDYTLTGIPDNGVVNAAIVQEKVEEEITEGKYAGRRMVHYGVVREMETLPALSNSGRISVPLLQNRSEGSFSVVVFLQDPGNMKVLAADSYRLMQSPVRK